MQNYVKIWKKMSTTNFFFLQIFFFLLGNSKSYNILKKYFKKVNYRSVFKKLKLKVGPISYVISCKKSQKAAIFEKKVFITQNFSG